MSERRSERKQRPSDGGQSGFVCRVDELAFGESPSSMTKEQAVDLLQQAGDSEVPGHPGWSGPKPKS